jgi:hypothetical protein
LILAGQRAKAVVPVKFVYDGGSAGWVRANLRSLKG